MLSDCLEFCSVIPLHWSKVLLGDTTVSYLNRILKMLMISNSAVTPFLYSFGNARRNTSTRQLPITVSTQNNRQRSVRSLRTSSMVQRH